MLTIKTELYFSQDKPKPLKPFLNKVVTPKFPGFSLFSVKGYWEGIAEDSYCLMIIHNGLDIDYEKISEICTAIKKEFNQSTVLKVDTETEVCFK